MAREINLVPDIKYEMIKTLKLRNFIFFLCIVVAAASVGVTAILGAIMGGQQLAIDGKKTTLTNMSAKISSFADLSDYLTIKDQLGNLSTIADNKKVVSRTFNILSALLPQGADTITISELSINLSTDEPTFTLDAQANAGAEPYIDYNVLDSFKKSMAYMRYDYGTYVDKAGNTIPAYCMVETGSDGATFKDAEKGLYAFWLINGEGCNPAAESNESSDENDENSEESTSDIAKEYDLEDYEGQQVVRIWRTPQFTDWYRQKEIAGRPYMDLSGNITNVAHFESSCISYSGDDSADSSQPEWTQTNECLLVPDGVDGIKILESSNGRNSQEDLVLRFSAVITLNPEVFKFSNYHMLALAPSGRVNVTDSFVQVQAMFGERATDCAEDDTTCNSATNRGGM